MLDTPARTPHIVVLPDEIDLNNAAVAAAMLANALNDPGLVIADMTGTTFCDSSGMRMLLHAHNRASASGSTLRIIVSPGGSVARSLVLLGLDRVLDVSATLEDALSRYDNH